jgi:hypothetical protein
VQNALYTAWKEPLNDTLELVILRRFDGNTWYRIPGFVIEKGGQLTDIALYKERLFVSGSFVLAGIKRQNCVALLNGRQWEGIGNFANPAPDPAQVTCMAVHDGKLFMGGGFPNSTLQKLIIWSAGMEQLQLRLVRRRLAQTAWYLACFRWAPICS